MILYLFIPITFGIFLELVLGVWTTVLEMVSINFCVKKGNQQTRGLLQYMEHSMPTYGMMTALTPGMMQRYDVNDVTKCRAL